MLSSFYPIVAGRISDASSRHRSLYQVQVGRIALQELERQLSTGERFTRPSDDPTAALRVIGLQRELEFREQTKRNLESAQGYLNASEGALSNIQDVLVEFRGLGIEASGNLSGDAERAGWITQIDSGIQRLVAAANTKYLDRYLFTGGVLQTPTVSQSNLAVTFQGNDFRLQSIANPQDYISHNVTGLKALGLISDAVQGTTPFHTLANGTTRLADLNSGRGVAPGAIQFSNGNESVVVDLANLEFTQEVIDKINNSVSLEGRAVRASLVSGAIVVHYADGNPGTLRISEVGVGRTASDLGIVTSSPSPSLPINGQSLSPITRGTSLLSQLNGGTGFDWSQGFRIIQGGKSFNVSFTGALTVEDALNAINQSGAAVVADLGPDHNSLRIRSLASGLDFSIAESSGTLASALGLRTFHAQTRLSELNFGRGVQFGEANDLRIQRNDGTILEVDLGGAITVQDVLDKINNHPDNQVAETRVLASLQSANNGFQLSSAIPASPAIPAPIQVLPAGGSQAAWDLGFVKKGTVSSTAIIEGSNYEILGFDPNPQEVQGTFNSLFRLREAIRNQDTGEILRATALIDKDISRLSLTRASLGVEQQRIDNLNVQQEENEVKLLADKSRIFDADIASIISELSGRQIAYEASLKLLANTGRLSLFNFL